MAKTARTISVHCAKCRTLLYKYHKGGRGGLVKCLLHRIAKDYTQGDMTCPNCGQEFARFQMFGRYPGHRIIRGKVFTKGFSQK